MHEHLIDEIPFGIETRVYHQCRQFLTPTLSDGIRVFFYRRTSHVVI